MQAAGDVWNSRDPVRVAGACTVGSRWRNRSEFITGRQEVVAFPTATWEREHDDAGRWWRSHGNESWEFDAVGYASRREGSIDEAERRIHGPRGEGERGGEIPLR